jgi:hypothetical protein
MGSQFSVFKGNLGSTKVEAFSQHFLGVQELGLVGVFSIYKGKDYAKLLLSKVGNYLKN